MIKKNSEEIKLAKATLLLSAIAVFISVMDMIPDTINEIPVGSIIKIILWIIFSVTIIQAFFKINK